MAKASAPKKKSGRRSNLLLTIVFSIIGVILTAGVGLRALDFKPGDAGKTGEAGSGVSGALGPIARFSYDLLFIFRENPPPEVCIVFMDEDAGRKLGQTSGVWDRSVHAQLVRRLTEQGARAIFLDLVFFEPAPDPISDEDLAAEMKENGNVFIGAQLELTTHEEVVSERVLAPIPVLRRAAAGWGVLAFRPVDTDYGVRFLYTGTETIPTATWSMAQKLGTSLTPEERNGKYWLNYYGGANVFPRISYDRALAQEGAPPGFFKDKIVFVGGGGRLEMSTVGRGKDDFAQPRTRFDSVYVPGAEIHATTFGNLYHRDWLIRWSRNREDAFVIGVGLLLGLLLPRFRWEVALVFCFLFATAVFFWVRGPMLNAHLWIDWCVPVFVQTPLAFAWSALSGYALVGRRRKLLHRALQGYLSPEIANLISESEFDLNLGGVELEVTVMFTDIEGFTPLSETLTPSGLSGVLTQYFTVTTGHILATRGTIVKFIGDAVLAVWGAPLPDAEHPIHAVLAGCQVRADQPFESDGRALLLRTRVGIHTGRVVAGNMGSAQRFDYTVIGDAVNFASRLEGLNKYLGTTFLVSDATLQRLENRFEIRCVGKFKVAGKTGFAVVHEVIGPVSAEAPPAWRERFANGLAAFQKGDLDLASDYFSEANRLRGGAGDSPAQYYLERIGELQKSGLPAHWEGIIELSKK